MVSLIGFGFTVVVLLLEIVLIVLLIRLRNKLKRNEKEVNQLSNDLVKLASALTLMYRNPLLPSSMSFIQQESGAVIAAELKIGKEVFTFENQVVAQLTESIMLLMIRPTSN